MSSERQPLLGSNSNSQHVSMPSDGCHHGNGVGKTYRARSTSSMIDNLEPVTLTWDNVNVYLNPPNRTCCRGPEPGAQPKHILRNVKGMVKPGTLLAILGASGSGKTTLLNTLTSRTNINMEVKGNVSVNGLQLDRGIRNISAYVQQDDLFISTMTVREHLTFRAMLHMDKDINTKRRLQRVQEVINELGLMKCAENIIGNPQRVKGISGGEMRRLSFASEVLTNPPLLFCDEATSGLDSFMAENIVQTLKNMSSKGRTILCTIHQPSSEVYALFDKVLVMAEGRVAYMGDTKNGLEFFSRTGYQCPINYNPADFYIMTLAVVPGREQECRSKVEAICDTFAKSSEYETMETEANQINKAPITSGQIYEEAMSNSSRYESSWFNQLGQVLKRCWLTNVREPMVVKVRVFQTIFISVLLGLIYLQLELDQQGVQNINGVIFLLITNITFTNVFAVVNVFPLEMPIFMREYGTGLYRVDVYFLAKTIAELPWFIIIPALFSAICYWMVGLYASAEAFFVCTGVLVLIAICSASFGYVISSLADSVNMALAIGPPLMVPLMMFGGFFLNTATIPAYFIWLEYISWFKYGFEMLAVNQWQNVDYISCPSSPGNGSMYINTTMPSNGCENRCPYVDGDSVLDLLKQDKDNMLLDLCLLIALTVGFRIISFITLLIKAKRSRA